MAVGRDVQGRVAGAEGTPQRAPLAGLAPAGLIHADHRRVLDGLAQLGVGRGERAARALADGVDRPDRDGAAEQLAAQLLRHRGARRGCAPRAPRSRPQAAGRTRSERPRWAIRPGCACRIPRTPPRARDARSPTRRSAAARRPDGAAPAPPAHRGPEPHRSPSSAAASARPPRPPERRRRAGASCPRDRAGRPACAGSANVDAAAPTPAARSRAAARSSTGSRAAAPRGARSAPRAA